MEKKCRAKYTDPSYIGMKYNRLTVVDAWIGDFHSHHSKVVVWKCQCDCGNETVARATEVANGYKKSCGCLSAEGLELGRAKRKYEVGQGYGERLYGIWNTMKQRCENPNNASYKYYGAKGVTVCNEWVNNYEAFREWAYANGYDENAPLSKHTCTIDRIDPFCNYEPSNCRWADAHTQNLNKRSNYEKNNTA